MDSRTLPIRGEQGKPKVLQISLRSFGSNPYGDHLWRVVWGPSRRYLVGGAWQDHHGEIPSDSEIIAKSGHDSSFVREVLEYRWVPKYPEAWVLEKWLTPIQYAGTPEQWVQTQSASEQTTCFLCGGTQCERCNHTGKVDGPVKWLTLGPYPNRGEYEGCYCFPPDIGEPSLSTVSSVIDMLVYGANYTLAERKQAIQAVKDGKKWDWRNRCEAIFKDSQGAFNNAPSNVNPAKRTADQVKLDIMADDLEMPIGDNKFFINPPKLEDNP
jgi:hypothetical protein